MTRKVSDWDFNNRHVQNDVVPGKFISSKTALVAFGPPRYSMIAAGDKKKEIGQNRVLSDFTVNEQIDQEKILENFGAGNSFAPLPVGLIQNVSMNQGRNIDKIFELGSELSYQVPGRVIPNFGFSKVLYHGPSLLKFAMVYYIQRLTSGEGLGGVDLEKVRNLSSLGEDFQLDLNGKNKAGEGSFFINLASELFQFPFGVLLYFKDNAGAPYGAVYIEECYITTHSLSMDVGATVIVENAGVDCANFLPLDVSSGFGETS